MGHSKEKRTPRRIYGGSHEFTKMLRNQNEVEREAVDRNIIEINQASAGKYLEE